MNKQLLLSISLGFRQPYLFAVGAMVMSYVFLFMLPLISRAALDILISGTDGETSHWLAYLVAKVYVNPESDNQTLALLLIAAVISLLFTGLAGVFFYLRGHLIATASEGIARRLRDRLLNHLNHLPILFHNNTDTGDLIQRCTSDVETFRVFLSGQIIEIARAILMLLVVTPILFTLHIKMALLSLASMPVLFVCAVLFFRKVKSVFTKVDESEARLTTVLQENLTGIRVVRAFARQEFEVEKFAESNALFREENKRLMRLLGGYYGFSDLICLGQIGVLLIAGAAWTITGELTVGTLFAFITYESMIIWPIRHMGRVLTDSSKAVVALGRLAEILTEPMESQNELSPRHRLQGKITFQDVRFCHEMNKPVLDNISLDIQPGQTVAFLGPPGSGKSTLVQLLLRLHDYQAGSIKLDHYELSELNRKYARNQMSIVMQEPFLFAASIRENLILGHLQASQEDIHRATMTAQIHDSILKFPRSYESLVGERGVTLSGGQRQRIALARALVKQPPILILDDSLSAVDTDTEAKILTALRAQRNPQTTIIIAHRLSSVMHADRIFVLNAGQIIQQGHHQTLSKQPGVYQKLCVIQGAIENDIELSEIQTTSKKPEYSG
ncbi:MAG: ABC transporter ATP-binding protein [Pseudomonadales bacterium]|nr:ABC transporter ATP-binding protein [Pseudomonadales bacterium]